VREATVTTRLHRARKRVAERLEPSTESATEDARAGLPAEAAQRPGDPDRVEESASADGAARERFRASGVL